LRTVEEEGTPRHASWLELFYDLVFVVVVSELASKLGGDVSLGGVFGYVLLFVPVWWTWIGTTFYNDRFDTDDLVHRGLIFFQMLAVGALAINVHDGLDGSSTGFALAYVAARALLVLAYIGARHYVSQARPLTTHYAKGFSLAAAIWLVSVFVPAPYRFVLWVIGVAVEFATPLTARHLQARTPLSTSHLPERSSNASATPARSGSTATCRW
jgi:low temperature requirement protein LtrA